MAEPFLGEIRLFPYNFAPSGWAFCNGQIMAIAQNTALFSLLGTTYGGNGTSNFALPDLRGRLAVSSGQGPGSRCTPWANKRGLRLSPSHRTRCRRTTIRSAPAPMTPRPRRRGRAEP